MNLKNLIAKILRAEPLNALEKAELENLDCDKFSEEKLADLRREKDSLQQELEALRRRQHMEKLCAQLHCTDPDYLEFRARQSRIDPGDEAAMREFAAELARHSPGCFTAPIAPGSSAGTPPASAPASGGTEGYPCDRIGALAASIGEAPDAR